jgi:serine/threonine protein kinase
VTVSGASGFRKSALASGLLTPEEIDAGIAKLCADNGLEPAEVNDELLAAKLIELGNLNRWQVEQLRAGRSKFNLGPYQVIDSIGQGGMGQVFKAEHTVMGRLVAVKVLPRYKSTPEAEKSFMREIRNQAQLDHHHLVRAYDAGHDGSVNYLVTEYVPGIDLRRFIRRHGRLTMAAAASVVSQAAHGLEHAHSRGLIHRDVKPGNLLVTPEGVVKVSDLGLAGTFNLDGEAQNLGEKIVGTADYLAPEQITAPQLLGPPTDVYSLGCTLYYAVTGKVPFPGGNAASKVRAHCQTEPIDPRRLNPELDDDFVEVIAAMMVKSPPQRMQTMGEVVRRLARWADQHAIAHAAATDHLDSIAVQSIHPTDRRRTPPVLSDTEPNFLIEPDQESGPVESPSQGHVHTKPVASATEETVPDYMSQYDESMISGLKNGPNHDRSFMFAAIAFIGALVLFGGVAVWLLLKG